MTHVLRRTVTAIHYVSDLMLEVCAAVRACHRISIVHRDLKPGNVFLADVDAGPGWQLKVLDFGVAKDPFGENLTAHGQVVGTLRNLGSRSTGPLDRRATNTR